MSANRKGGGKVSEYPQMKVPEREIDMIRGKMLVNAASKEELHTFLFYVTALECLVDEASMEDFYGTEGWRHAIGWDD